jgi:hypothetical protein
MIPASPLIVGESTLSALSTIDLDSLSTTLTSHSQAVQAKQAQCTHQIEQVFEIFIKEIESLKQCMLSENEQNTIIITEQQKQKVDDLKKYKEQMNELKHEIVLNDNMATEE